MMKTCRRLIASPCQKLQGEASVPGDKSVSHRAIIMASMAHGTSVLRGLSDGEDVKRTLDAVQAFGAAVSEEDGATLIQGTTWTSPNEPIECGNSGTSARLLMGAAAGVPGITATFIGDESLSQRPMKRLIAPLRRMGATFEPRHPETLPLTMRGRELAGICHRNNPASAQVKTALLLAGLNAIGHHFIIERTPSRDHGEVLLNCFGCSVGRQPSEFGDITILNGERRLRPAQIEIGGDPSSAAFLLVAGLVVPRSRIRVQRVLLNPTRTGLFDVLAMMGAKLDIKAHDSLGGELIGDIASRSTALKAVIVPPSYAPRMIDEYPIAAVAAAFAKGQSVFRGLSELRFKESNRLEKLVDGLVACGVDASVIGDDLLVNGTGARPRGGATIDSGGDHRIAMAFAVLGLGAERSVTIDGADMIATSFPAYVSTMRMLGADMQVIP